jgi:hypothetical protein
MYPSGSGNRWTMPGWTSITNKAMFPKSPAMDASP